MSFELDEGLQDLFNRAEAMGHKYVHQRTLKNVTPPNSYRGELNRFLYFLEIPVKEGTGIDALTEFISELEGVPDDIVVNVRRNSESLDVFEILSAKYPITEEAEDMRVRLAINNVASRIYRDLVSKGQIEDYQPE